MRSAKQRSCPTVTDVSFVWRLSAGLMGASSLVVLSSAALSGYACFPGTQISPLADNVLVRDAYQSTGQVDPNGNPVYRYLGNLYRALGDRVVSIADIANSNVNLTTVINDGLSSPCPPAIPVCGAPQSSNGNVGVQTPGVGSAGGGVTPGTFTGSSGPPSLSSVEISSSQAEEFIRQRRQQSQQQAQGAIANIQTPVDQQQPNAVQPAGTVPSANRAAASPQRSVASRGSEAGRDVRNQPPTSSSNSGVWVQAYGDYEHHSNLAPGSPDNPTRKQKTVGVVAGSDVTYRRETGRGQQAVQFGLLGGHNNTRSKFSDTENVTDARQDSEGGFVGAYSTYQFNNFAIDSLVKADFFDTSRRAIVRRSRTNQIAAVIETSRPACPPGQAMVIDGDADLLPTQREVEPARTVTETSRRQEVSEFSEHNYIVSANAYYRVDLLNGFWLEPTAGFRYTFTNFSQTRNETFLNLEDGHVLRAQVGARIGSSWELSSKQMFTASILGLIYSDVLVDGFTLIDSGFVSTVSNVDEGKLRGLGQINLQFDTGRGVFYSTEVAVRGGEDVWGVGGRLGIRYEW